MPDACGVGTATALPGAAASTGPAGCGVAATAGAERNQGVRDLSCGVAGAAVGGLLGSQVGSGSGRTAATIAGAGVGAYAGYKLAEEKPPAQAAAPQPAQPACTLATHYRVSYARTNGLQGDVMMSSHPTGASLMINFCGDRPCN